MICLIAIQMTLPNELRELGSAFVSLGNMLLGLGCGPTVVALVTEHVYGRPDSLSLSIVTVTAAAFAVAILVLAAMARDARDSA